MKLAKVHLLEGQYDTTRIGKILEATRNALIQVLGTSTLSKDGTTNLALILPRLEQRLPSGGENG